MPTNANFSGVSNCYVFKSQLQEYAQKKGLATPVYETIKEGPSHEPSFRSFVIVNDVKYDSLPGFFNRKAAEQSAAEVALMQLCKSGEVNEIISQPVQETGLCKNLLQEYAQKMNFAMPVYLSEKVEVPGRMAHFSCAVEIGGIRYIGGQATTKKEAEIKAARTALLAIRSSTSEPSNMGEAQLKVIPCRKRAIEKASNPDDTVKVPKAKKKARIKKKMLKAKLSGNNADHSQHKTTGNSAVVSDDLVKPEWVQTISLAALSSETLATNVSKNLPETKIESDSSEQMPCADVALASQEKMLKAKLSGSNADHSQHKTTGNSAVVSDDLVKPEWVQTNSLTALSSETLATNVSRNLPETKIESDSSEKMPCADVALASQEEMLKTKLSGNNADHSQRKTTGNSAVVSDDLVKSEWVQTDSLTALSSETLATNVTRNLHETKIESDSIEQMPCADVALVSQVADNCKNGQLKAMISVHSNHEAPDVDGLSSVVSDQTPSRMEVSKIMAGPNQAVERIHANTGQE